MNTVYLAGPITGLSYAASNEWRNDTFKAKVRVAGWEPLSPFDGAFGQKAEVVEHDEPLQAWFEGDPEASVVKDLLYIDKSNAILANLTDTSKASIGTCMEIGYAFGKSYKYDHKTIIVVGPDRVHDHPFIKVMATNLVPTLDDAVEVLRALQ